MQLHNQVTAFILNSGLLEIFNISMFKFHIWFIVSKFFCVIGNILSGNIQLKISMKLIRLTLSVNVFGPRLAGILSSINFAYCHFFSRRRLIFGERGRVNSLLFRIVCK